MEHKPIERSKARKVSKVELQYLFLCCSTGALSSTASSIFCLLDVSIAESIPATEAIFVMFMSQLVRLSQADAQRRLEENILSMSDAEDCELPLVDLLRDLVQIGGKLKDGIQSAIEKDVATKAKKAEQGESSDSEEDDDEEDDEDQEESDNDEEDDEDDGDSKKEKKITEKKPEKTATNLEQLLETLHLHKRQKQNLLIKKAILLKLEEALFGNNDITMTLDLRKMGEEEKDGKLEEILACKDLTCYIPKSVTENGTSMEFAEKAALREIVSTAEGPPDILKPFRSKTPKKIAVNLIRQQYNIRWNTQSGESKPFDFYLLPKQFAKGIVRKMHIQTELFEHKADIVNLRHRLNPTGQVVLEDFCPKNVFIKKDPYRKDSDSDISIPIRARDEPKYSWQKWGIQTSDCTELGFEFPAELKWIDPKVKTLIKKLSHPLSDDFNPESTKNLMYLIVVNETVSTILTEVGNCSQVYIGAADEGLYHRFLDENEGHCAKLKQLYEEFSLMESFIPNSTALLVELRILLALARREQFAIFAIQAFDEPRTLGRELHDLIIQALYLANNEIWGPAVNMRFGLNVKEELKKRRKYLPDHFPGSRRRKKK